MFLEAFTELVLVDGNLGIVSATRSAKKAVGALDRVAYITISRGEDSGTSRPNHLA